MIRYKLYKYKWYINGYYRHKDFLVRKSINQSGKSRTCHLSQYSYYNWSRAKFTCMKYKLKIVFKSELNNLYSVFFSILSYLYVCSYFIHYFRPKGFGISMWRHRSRLDPDTISLHPYWNSSVNIFRYENINQLKNIVLYYYALQNQHWYSFHAEIRFKYTTFKIINPNNRMSLIFRYWIVWSCVKSFALESYTV